MKTGDGDRWQRLATLFGAALDRPEPERGGFLAAECGDDAVLLGELEALLSSHADAERLLGESVSGYVAPVFAGSAGAEDDALEETENGRQIGAYRVLHQIGRGGMGAVYLAERADEQYRKQVALKLVKRGMDTDEVLRRFRYERQILASLEHPNVARLLDGGVTDDGLPYIVMEYVPGRPIDRYADERRLTIEERLDLFRVVCEAVQYAHQNLVVHRDIKPSNILITDDGSVKLLDFGIAKLLEDGAEGERDEPTEAPRTRTGFRIMTPEHAAPEQIRGGPITTATDVYALGGLLYQLLTGRRPLKAAGRRGRELEDAVLQEEPERPSAAVGRADAGVLAARRIPSDRLRRRLRGDLDLILLKALEKDPARRYQSAQQLLDDLDRHRRGLPVRARPGTLAYRLRKFARRQRAGLAGGAAVLLVIAGFAGFHSARITGERDRARTEAEKARASTEFLQRLLGDAYPSVALGDTFSMGTLLARAEARIDSLDARPELQAELLRTLGDVYREQGRFPDALRLIERAVALHRGSREPRSLAAGNAMSALGHLRYQMKDFEEALRAHREELEIFQAVVAPDDSLVLYAMNNIAAAASALGRHEEAMTLHQEVLARRRRLFGDSSALVHVTRNNLGHLHHAMRNLTAAEEQYREALAIRRAVLSPDHPSTALTVYNLALVHKDMNQLGQAESMLREALAGSRRILGGDHPQVGLVAYGLAGVLKKSGNAAEAESLYRVTLAIDRKTLGDEHLEIAVDLHAMGNLLSENGDCAAAASAFQEAQVILDKHELPREHRRQIANRGALGACFTALKRFPEAEPLLLASYGGARSADTAGGSETAREALERMVRLYQAWGRSEKAERYGRALLDGGEAPPAMPASPPQPAPPARTPPRSIQ